MNLIVPIRLQIIRCVDKDKIIQLALIDKIKIRHIWRIFLVLKFYNLLTSVSRQ